MRRFAFLGLVILSGSPIATQGDDAWTQRFTVEPGELAPTGRNPYFILEPGYQAVLEDGAERLVITVLAETRTIDGVETRVVEERETKAAALVEISRNYYAISRLNGNVYYFGEDVDMYKAGKVVSHDGAWLSGVNGARFGQMMPGKPVLNARYYEEVAPKVAMDRAQVVSTTEQLTTRAGRFANVLKIEETTPLEAGHKEYKWYGAGVGLLRDGGFKLVRSGPTVAPKR